MIDHHGDAVQQALLIRKRFIETKAEFVINVSGQRRRQIMKTDFASLSAGELKHVFDGTYHAVYKMLQLDSFQRFLSTTSSADKLCKKILRKKRRKRRLHKTKERTMSKRKTSNDLKV